MHSVVNCLNQNHTNFLSSSAIWCNHQVLWTYFRQTSGNSVFFGHIFTHKFMAMLLCTGDCSRTQVPRREWRWRARRRPNETSAVHVRSYSRATSSRWKTGTWTECRLSSDWRSPSRQPASTFYHPPTRQHGMLTGNNDWHTATKDASSGEWGQTPNSSLLHTHLMFLSPASFQTKLFNIFPKNMSQTFLLAVLPSAV